MVAPAVAAGPAMPPVPQVPGVQPPQQNLGFQANPNLAGVGGFAPPGGNPGAVAAIQNLMGGFGNLAPQGQNMALNALAGLLPQAGQQGVAAINQAGLPPQLLQAVLGSLQQTVPGMDFSAPSAQNRGGTMRGGAQGGQPVSGGAQDAYSMMLAPVNEQERLAQQRLLAQWGPALQGLMEQLNRAGVLESDMFGTEGSQLASQWQNTLSDIAMSAQAQRTGLLGQLLQQQMGQQFQAGQAAQDRAFSMNQTLVNQARQQQMSEQARREASRATSGAQNALYQMMQDYTGVAPGGEGNMERYGPTLGAFAGIAQNVINSFPNLSFDQQQALAEQLAYFGGGLQLGNIAAGQQSRAGQSLAESIQYYVNLGYDPATAQILATQNQGPTAYFS